MGLGGVRWHKPARIFGKQTRDPRSYEKVTGLWEIDVSVCNIFSRISHGCCMRVKKWAMLLETYVLIARSCCSFIALISRGYTNSTNPGAVVSLPW